MSKAEENFMETRRKMEFYINKFYEACGEIDIDDDGFAEDVTEAIEEATNKSVTLELD